MFKDPAGYHLLSVIAMRADRVTGEAKMGDWEEIGATSRATYRATIKRLQSNQQITTRTTNRGTFAKLVDSRIFDINEVQENHLNDQHNDQQTDEKQPPEQPPERPLTRSSRSSRIKKEVQEVTHGFDEFWLEYPSHRRGSKPNALKLWKALCPDLQTSVIDHVRERVTGDPEWRKENFKYVPHAERFLKHERFNDVWAEAPTQQWSDTTQKSISNLQGVSLA